ncbi:nitrile hydratase subunit beta [Solirubrobacter phytolaccae]|uniref:Nitrile hydratase subunit beta n=1 Tax=Solirubrobacter phytolaccae TaxID=1404360 RepID=A0A9X3NCA1_9ACTN|nr:nitrile hydratase subunit beta [Solirubrobacter phytolaccae]MDA0179982.1 nitrile hydratase subunit beta [Solirubrobacter phytolaccae]
MNGAHDMGGVHGFGPVVAEVDEPLFHAEWEKRVLGLVLALGAGGKWNIDISRFARENRPPAEYLSLSYYEIWLAGLERLLEERGRPTRVLAAADVPATLARGGPVDREPTHEARFAVGDAVVTKNLNPHGHTRLPRYARGKHGVIERVHGFHVFPDVNSTGTGEDPQWLYLVRFSGSELFGPDGDPGSSVSIDAFEPYLEPA